MITGIPSGSDFKSTALALFNLAWDAVVDPLIFLRESEENDKEMVEEFWRSARHTVNSAYSLVQQGSEFLLKGKIADFNPILLLGGAPKDWPKGCEQRDVTFSEFRSIDAKDLCRCYDTFLTPRLSPDFKQLFSRLRETRNTLMHTATDLKIEAKEIVIGILQACDHLIAPRSWPQARYAHFEGGPLGQMDESDKIVRLQEEYEAALSLLTRAESMRYFGLDKKNQFYACPECAVQCESDYDLPICLAQLQAGGNLFCFLCQRDSKIKHANCNNPECKSNILSGNGELCLVCGCNQD